MARHARSLCAPIRIAGTRNEIAVDVGLVWTAAAQPRVRGFVGMSQTRSGTHLRGLSDGMSSALVALDPARFATVYPAALAEVIEQGLVAVINVMLRDPRFGTPRRDQLVNPEVQEAVSALVTAELHARLVADPALREILLGRMP